MRFFTPRLVLPVAAAAASFVLGRRFLRPVLLTRAPRVGRNAGPVTQALAPRAPADRLTGAPTDDSERRLDEGVEETFPASDPVAVSIE
jgi:hypothetical protein